MAQLADGEDGGRGGDGRGAALRRVADAAVYGALRAVWWLLGATTPAAARAFLERVGSAVAAVDRRHRRVVESNLAIAFPGMDPVVRDSVVVASFRNWGRIAAEVVHSDRMVAAAEGGDWDRVAEEVRRGLAQGRGLLLLTAHTGNFELLARIFSTRVAPVAVFHRTLGTPLVDRFVVRERARFGTRTLRRGAAVRDALRLLADGSCVAVPLDQNQRPGRGIFVDVLGSPACTSTMLARLSLASGAPVLPVFAVWSGEATRPFVGELLPAPSELVPPAQRPRVIESLTARYCAEIDAVVRRFPHQWNWAHRRWKTRPAAVPTNGERRPSEVGHPGTGEGAGQE